MKIVYFLPSFYATFSSDATMLKKNKEKFCPPKHKKMPSKAAHNPTRPTVQLSSKNCYVKLRQFYSLKFSQL